MFYAANSLHSAVVGSLACLGDMALQSRPATVFLTQVSFERRTYYENLTSYTSPEGVESWILSALFLYSAGYGAPRKMFTVRKISEHYYSTQNFFFP